MTNERETEGLWEGFAQIRMVDAGDRRHRANASANEVLHHHPQRRDAANQYRVRKSSGLNLATFNPGTCTQ